MSVEGGTDWILEAIQDRSLVAVTDGLYIGQLYPNLCLAAFVLGCVNGGGKIIGSFAEPTLAANAYRGKLLGLMAIHLLLVSVNRVQTSLVGSGEVVSDCLGGLKHVAYLLPCRIPLRWKHLDILKNVLVNYRGSHIHLILLSCESPPGLHCHLWQAQPEVTAELHLWPLSQAVH